MDIGTEMIEAVIVEIAKQVPALAVLGYIVWVFVKYIGSRDETLGEVQRESIVVMREVSRSIGEVTVALSNLNGKRG